MRITVLGSAAGGGFPQWNCRCPTCEAARGGAATPRTQSSIAVRGAEGPWLLANASPDLRQQLELFAGEPHAEPDPLHLGHVPQQPEQGQLGWRNGPAGQLLAGQAGALIEQRRALPVQERLQHRAFGTGQRSFGPLNFWGYPRHGAIIPCRDAPPPAIATRASAYLRRAGRSGGRVAISGGTGLSPSREARYSTSL